VTSGEHHPILWVIVLVATIVAAVVATVVDNAIKSPNRCHNTVLLFNECLAEQYSAYFVFFMALGTGTTFTQVWGTGLLVLLLLIAVALYVKGIHSTTKHGIKIAKDHACMGDQCEAKLSNKTIVRICGLNMFFAIIMFASACYLSTITLKNPTQ
jgi:hypothetical protein